MSAKLPNLQERKKTYLISNADEIYERTRSKVMSRDVLMQLFIDSVREHFNPIKGYDHLAVKAAEVLAEKKARNKASYEKRKEHCSAYYHANKERNAEANSKRQKVRYYAKRDEILNYYRSDEGRAKKREYNKRESVVARRKIRTAQPKNRIVMNQRSRLRDFIRSTGSHVHLRFGCSADFMRAHIEKQFTKGMTWDNYGEWHIDHIMPCAQFDLSNQMHADICFNWQNLRPLWARENLSKSDMITHPQLCLPIAA
jgi:hypothetical protein